VLVPVHDPELVARVWDAAIGERRQLLLRGTPGYDMPEVKLDAVIAAKVDGDFGRTVRLDVGSFHVAVSERPPLPIHPVFWRDLGLEPRSADAIVQKNFFHYRMFYLTSSLHHIPVVSDGASSLQRLGTLDYRVPTYPQSDPEDWRPHDPILRGASSRGDRPRRVAHP
jgi:microcystin degradation protein MlrC